MIHKKGFTLIELLVVVAIIGVLASVILTSLGTARRKAKISKLVTQFQQIEKAFIMTYIDEDRTAWWRESELNLGSDPTLKKIIALESGPLSGLSDYFPHDDLVDELTDSQYRYDHDEDVFADCSGGSSNWNKGVNLTVTGLTLEEKIEIDKYVDQEEDYKCGKITYGNTGNGSLYWRITSLETTF